MSVKNLMVYVSISKDPGLRPGGHSALDLRNVLLAARITESGEVYEFLRAPRWFGRQQYKSHSITLHASQVLFLVTLSF